jgi:hypothetical protein
MARGGYRPGAGRPKGPAEKPIDKAARKAGLSPLDYMLAVMNDEAAEDVRRDRMAIAAAPFVHAKPGDAPKGKKEEATEKAASAGVGTEWGDDLGSGVSLN